MEVKYKLPPVAEGFGSGGSSKGGGYFFSPLPLERRVNLFVAERGTGLPLGSKDIAEAERDAYISGTGDIVAKELWQKHMDNPMLMIALNFRDPATDKDVILQQNLNVVYHDGGYRFMWMDTFGHEGTALDLAAHSIIELRDGHEFVDDVHSLQHDVFNLTADVAATMHDLRTLDQDLTRGDFRLIGSGEDGKYVLDCEKASKHFESADGTVSIGVTGSGDNCKIDLRAISGFLGYFETVDALNNYIGSNHIEPKPNKTCALIENFPVLSGSFLPSIVVYSDDGSWRKEEVYAVSALYTPKMGDIPAYVKAIKGINKKDGITVDENGMLDIDVHSATGLGEIKTQIGKGVAQPTKTIKIHAGEYNASEQSLEIFPLQLKTGTDGHEDAKQINYIESTDSIHITNVDGVAKFTVTNGGKKTFLGFFDEASALLNKAKRYKESIEPYATHGYVRQAPTGDVTSEKAEKYLIYQWKGSSSKAAPTDAEVLDVSNWNTDNAMATSGYPVLPVGSGTSHPSWTPSDTSSAKLHKGQVVFYTADSKWYWSDGSSWSAHFGHGEPNYFLGFVNSVDQLPTDSSAIEGKSWAYVLMPVDSGVVQRGNPTMVIRQGGAWEPKYARGSIVAKKSGDGSYRHIEKIVVAGNTAGTTFNDGVLNLNIPASGGSSSPITMDDKEVKTVKKTDYTFLSPAGDLIINGTFLGIFDSKDDLINKLKPIKELLVKDVSFGYIRKTPTGLPSTDVKAQYYKVWRWNSSKEPSTITDTDIEDVKNWDLEFKVASADFTITVTGENSEYPAWKPEQSTPGAPLIASQHIGQIVYWNNSDTNKKGHYWSNGSTWTKLGSGSGPAPAAPALEVKGLVDWSYAASQHIQHNVAQIDFGNLAVLKNTVVDGANHLSVTTGIAARTENTATGDVSGDTGHVVDTTASEMHLAVNKIDIVGDKTCASIDDGELTISVVKPLLIDATKSGLDAHASASVGRFGYAKNNKSVYVNTTGTWEEFGYPNMGKDVKSLVSRFPDKIDTSASSFSDSDEFLGYKYIAESVAGSMKVPNPESGILQNMAAESGGDKSKWVQKFYGLETGSEYIRVRIHNGSDYIWGSWKQSATLGDNCYSVMVMQNGWNYQDLFDNDYKLPCNINQDPMANIKLIPPTGSEKHGHFQVMREGIYDITVRVQATAESGLNITGTSTGADITIEKADGTIVGKLTTANNIYDSATREFHPLHGVIKGVHLVKGETYAMEFDIQRGITVSDRKKLLFDPFKNIVAIDPTNSNTKTGANILNGLYDAMGGWSAQKGYEIRVEQPSSGSTPRVFGEVYLTEEITLTQTS